MTLLKANNPPVLLPPAELAVVVAVLHPLVALVAEVDAVDQLLKTLPSCFAN